MSSSANHPKFYKSDIMALIMERNQLKEQVLQLEEEVASLKLKIRGNCQCCIEQEPRLLSSKNSEELSSQVGPTPVSVLDKPTRTTAHVESYTTDVIVSGYLKKGRKYVYTIRVTWSDGQRFEVYRSYGEFFTLRNALVLQFPEQDASPKSSPKSVKSSIPPLTNHTWHLFGRINTESLTKAKLRTINSFCQMMLLGAETRISRSSEVIEFFKPGVNDNQLPRLKKKTDLDFSILSLYPQNSPPGSLFEQYLVLADYSGESDNEISAKAGEIVRLIHKLDSGWWLVSNDGSGRKQIGYISADFLKLYEDKGIEWRTSKEESNGMFDTSKVDPEMKYVAVEDYSTSDSRQLSFCQGDLMIILEKCDDGWWLAILNVKQGWVPSSFLAPLEASTTSDNNKDFSLENRGQEYVAKVSYQGEQKEDVTFPKGARLEVLEKNENGWWLVRYHDKVGVAPANLLIAAQSKCTSSEDKLESELKQSFSRIAGPPPRSKQFLQSTQKSMRQRISKSSTHRPMPSPKPHPSHR